jgi:hypothetical protein
MPYLIFSIDLTASPLELAAQALAIVRMQEFARRKGLKVQEREDVYKREFDLVIPAEGLNEVLYELDLQGLLPPMQEITGSPKLHVKLEERFSTLTWVDANE